jgi:hypothetical protein
MSSAASDNGMAQDASGCSKSGGGSGGGSSSSGDSVSDSTAKQQLLQAALLRARKRHGKFWGLKGDRRGNAVLALFSSRPGVWQPGQWYQVSARVRACMRACRNACASVHPREAIRRLSWDDVPAETDVLVVLRPPLRPAAVKSAHGCRQ